MVDGIREIEIAVVIEGCAVARADLRLSCRAAIACVTFDAVPR
jgi:hypothetical protein